MRAPSAEAADGGDGEALELLNAVERDLLWLMGEEVRLQRGLSEATRDSERQDRARLLSLIELVDAFQRVFAAVDGRSDDVTPQMRKWLANFKTIGRMLDALLRRDGVVPIEILGDQFDPAWHRILRTVVDAERPEGTIVEVTSTGYLWRGQLLRETEVVVVGPPSAEPVVSEVID